MRSGCGGSAATRPFCRHEPIIAGGTKQFRKRSSPVVSEPVRQGARSCSGFRPQAGCKPGPREGRAQLAPTISTAAADPSGSGFHYTATYFGNPGLFKLAGGSTVCLGTVHHFEALGWLFALLCTQVRLFELTTADGWRCSNPAPTALLAKGSQLFGGCSARSQPHPYAGPSRACSVRQRNHGSARICDGST